MTILTLLSTVEWIALFLVSTFFLFMLVVRRERLISAWEQGSAFFMHSRPRRTIPNNNGSIKRDLVDIFLYLLIGGLLFGIYIFFVPNLKTGLLMTLITGLFVAILLVARAFIFNEKPELNTSNGCSFLILLGILVAQFFILFLFIFLIPGLIIGFLGGLINGILLSFVAGVALFVICNVVLMLIYRVF